MGDIEDLPCQRYDKEYKLVCMEEWWVARMDDWIMKSNIWCKLSRDDGIKVFNFILILINNTLIIIKMDEVEENEGCINSSQ